MAASEAALAELELLAAMYDVDDLHVTQPSDQQPHMIVALRLLPRSGGEALQRWMECTIEFILPDGYPDVAASARVLRARGLVDDEEARLVATASQSCDESAADGEGALWTASEALIGL